MPGWVLFAVGSAVTLVGACGKNGQEMSGTEVSGAMPDQATPSSAGATSEGPANGAEPVVSSDPSGSSGAPTAAPTVSSMEGGGGAPGVAPPGDAGAGPDAASGGDTGMGGSSAAGNGGGGTAGAEVGGGAGMLGEAGDGSMGGNADAGGGVSPSERFVCPEGPFPMPEVLSSEDVCGDFEFAETWNEGPTWVASQNAFFFTNFRVGAGTGGDIIRYTPGAGCETFIEEVGCNGLAVSNDGKLLAACQQSRSVLAFDLETKEATTVADEYMGMMLDTPNDLVQHSNGTIYFTNPTNELDGRSVGVGPAAFRIDPAGTLSMISEGNCNGIALSPDEGTLYVLLIGMWDLDAEGVPSNQQSIFTRGDGMAVDCAGNVYANGSIFDADGEMIGDWGGGTNLAFGGEDNTTLLVVSRGSLRTMEMNVPGFP